MSRMTPQARRSVSSRSLLHFFAYYFRHYISHDFSPFLYDFSRDLDLLATSRLREVAAITYRGSAKTSVTKAFVTSSIVHAHYKYINVDAYDGTNSERILFDVISELQNNKLLISDYGNLFNAARSSSTVTQKRVKDFLTTNGIRVEAHTTQEPVRGRLHVSQRPDLLILDDFETSKTVASEAATATVRRHINEARPGMDPLRNSVVYLGNYISEYGNVQYVLDKLNADPLSRTHLVPLIDPVTSLPTWPQRFTLLSPAPPSVPKLVSIPELKASMRNPDTGDEEFNMEMLCDPQANSAKVFKRDFFVPTSLEAIRDQNKRVYFVVDPGGSGDEDDLKTKDDAGFCICWLTPDRIWHLKAWGSPMGPTELIATMIDTLKWLKDINTPASVLAWEKNMYTNALKPALYTAMREANCMMPVREIKNTRKKEDRIRGALLNRYETGTIRHLSGECSKLEHQLLAFPNSRRDDVMDAVSFLADVIVPTPEHPAGPQSLISRFLK